MKKIKWSCITFLFTCTMLTLINASKNHVQLTESHLKYGSTLLSSVRPIYYALLPLFPQHHILSLILDYLFVIPAGSTIHLPWTINRFSSYCFSPTTRYLVIGHTHEVHIWQVTTGQWKKSFPVGGIGSHVEQVAMSADDRTLAICTTDAPETVSLWSSTTGCPFGLLSVGYEPKELRFFFHDQRLLTMPKLCGCPVRIWTVTGGITSPHDLPANLFWKTQIHTCDISMDNSYIAVACGPKLLLFGIHQFNGGYVYKGDFFQNTYSQRNKRQFVCSCAFSNDASIIVSAGYAIVRIWSVTTGNLLNHIDTHRLGSMLFSVVSVGFVRDHPTRIVIASFESCVAVWDTEREELTTINRLTNLRIYHSPDVHLSAEQSLLILPEGNPHSQHFGLFGIYDVLTGELIHEKKHELLK